MSNKEAIFEGEVVSIKYGKVYLQNVTMNGELYRAHLVINKFRMPRRLRGQIRTYHTLRFQAYPCVYKSIDDNGRRVMKRGVKNEKGFVIL
jgi:hypothetical protein